MNKTMIQRQLSPVPMVPKRRRDEFSPSKPSQAKRAKLVQWVNKSCNDAAVAKALLVLKSNTSSTRSPMAQWVKLFDEETSSDTEEDSNSEDETKLVKTLVQAAFSKQQPKSSTIARLVSSSILQVEQIKPDDHLKTLLSAKGKSAKYSSAESLTGFFEKVTEEFCSGYTMELANAVRQDDVATLRRLKTQGRTMLCGTKFGDSVVHLACRRNCADVLDFLLNEVGVSCRLSCDYGRTPLHDACWTSKPNWRIMDMLLNACPDLLYVTDKRGSTPLAYLPKEHWGAMCRFLEERGIDRLVPREIR